MKHSIEAGRIESGHTDFAFRRALWPRAVRVALLAGCAGLAIGVSSAAANQGSLQAPMAPPIPSAPLAPSAPPAPAEVLIARNDSKATSIDERRPLQADGSVSISNVAGSVDVLAWDKNEVYLTGELGDDVDHLDISGDAAHLVIAVKLPPSSHLSGDSNLKLMVPAGAHVDIQSVSADVSVKGTRAPVKVNTVSGEVELQLDSPEVSVQTVSGDLTLHSPSKTTYVNSVSGDLHLAGPQGALTLETVSGDVELDGGKFTLLKLKSISGDMRLNVSLAEQGKVTGETLSGDIVMQLPANVVGSAQLKSFSGEAHCDGTQSTAAHGDRKHEYVWGDGNGANVDLSSFSGDIRVERGK